MDLVCADCVFVYFYDEYFEPDNREPNRRPLDRLGDYEMSLPDNGPFFSWGGCATCSTYLGGDRFEVELSKAEGVRNV